MSPASRSGTASSNGWHSSSQKNRLIEKTVSYSKGNAPRTALRTTIAATFSTEVGVSCLLRRRQREWEWERRAIKARWAPELLQTWNSRLLAPGSALLPPRLAPPLLLFLPFRFSTAIARSYERDNLLLLLLLLFFFKVGPAACGDDISRRLHQVEDARQDERRYVQDPGRIPFLLNTSYFCDLRHAADKAAAPALELGGVSKRGWRKGKNLEPYCGHCYHEAHQVLLSAS